VSPLFAHTKRLSITDLRTAAAQRQSRCWLYLALISPESDRAVIAKNGNTNPNAAMTRLCVA